MSTPTPDQLLAALRARGIVPRGTTPVRDAVHEACHALTWEIPEPWSREAIAAGAPESNGEKFEAECIARAVEGLVCRAVGAECPDLDARVLLAAMEATRIDRYTVPFPVWRDMVRRFEGSAVARDLTERILALVDLDRPATFQV